MASLSFLYILDIFLDLTDIFLVLFILSGWLFPRLREVHLAVILLTGFSWLIFSEGDTFGHCILTDWHWEVLRKPGETNLPDTYNQYLFERVTGMPVQRAAALTITCSSLLFSLIFSSVLVLRNYSAHADSESLINNYPAFTDRGHQEYFGARSLNLFR